MPYLLNTTTYVEFLIDKHDEIYNLTDYNIKKSFESVYTERVHHKMQWNELAFETGFDFKKKYNVPKFMMEGSLKRLTKKWVDSSSTRLELTAM